MEDNKKIKETLLHYINLEYYANGLDEEFQTLLKELEDRCAKAILSLKSVNTKKSYSVIMKLIKEEVEEFRKELEERLEEEAEAIMQQELEFLDKLYNKSDSKANALVLGGVTVAALLSSVFDGTDTTGQFLERTRNNIISAYENSLRSGFIFGQSSDDIISQTSSKLSQVSRGLQGAITTVIPSYAKTTDRIVFLNNNVEVVWVATLDGRTCIHCASMSGLHFKSVEEAPFVPAHERCRCILAPVTSLKQPVLEYEEFIESLTEEEQLGVLGKNRFDLWKKYRVPLRKFINNGTVIPWKDFKAQTNLPENDL